MEYVFLEMFGETPEDSISLISSGFAPHIGMTWSLQDLWKVKLELGWFRSIYGLKKEYLRSSFDQRFSISQNLDFRFEIEHFEEAKNLSLEELNENTCKYMEGHPTEKDSTFCGRKTVEKRSYCPLHMMLVFQFRENAKGKREEVSLKEDDVPAFLEKKVKSA